MGSGIGLPCSSRWVLLRREQSGGVKGAAPMLLRSSTSARALRGHGQTVGLQPAISQTRVLRVCAAYPRDACETARFLLRSGSVPAFLCEIIVDLVSEIAGLISTLGKAPCEVGLRRPSPISHAARICTFSRSISSPVATDPAPLPFLCRKVTQKLLDVENGRLEQERSNIGTGSIHGDNFHALAQR